MPVPPSTIRATFHNASLALKVRSSVVAGIPGSRAATTASLGQPVFPLSVVIFELSVALDTVPLHSVLAHLTTALKQNMTTMGLSAVVLCSGSGQIKVQPIISAKQVPGPALYLESVSLRYGFQRTEDAEIPLSGLLEECHQRLLGSFLIRRYPLVFGTWKFRFTQEQQAISSIANSTLSIAKRSLHSTFQRKFKGNMQKLKATLTSDQMDDSTSVASREAVQKSLELLFVDQIRPRVMKLDFTKATTDLGNLEVKYNGDPQSQVPGSAARSRTTAESQSQGSTTHEDEGDDDLDLLARDLDPEFGDSSGSEMLDDWETELGIVF